MERAHRRYGDCCGRAICAEGRSPGEAGSSGFRVGKVSRSSCRSTGAWTDAAAGRRRSCRASRSRSRGVGPPRPFFLRPRGRATVVVVVLGLPLLLAYASAQILPDALWFDELGQLDVFRRVAAAKAELWLAVAGTVALFVGGEPRRSRSRATASPGRGAVSLAVVAASLVTATFFASSAARSLADVPALAPPAAASASRIRCSARTSASSSSRSRSSSWCRGCCSGSSRSRPPPSALVYRRRTARSGSGRSARPRGAGAPRRPRRRASCSSWRGDFASGGTPSSSASPRPPTATPSRAPDTSTSTSGRPGLAALSDPGPRAGAGLRRRPAHGEQRIPAPSRGC